MSPEWSPTEFESSYWHFADMIPGAPSPENRLPGFPGTPVVSMELPDIGSCLFKMEQDCPTGSHKDRAAIFQASVEKSRNAAGLIIPSSGNAAIAVSAAGSACGLPVYAFLSVETDPGKLAAMARYKPRLVFCPNPVNRARNAARRFGLPNLRPSRDENAIRGFMTLGFELNDYAIRRIFSSIFVFSTSGATLTGIARAYEILRLTGRLRRMPELHAVQAGNASELARHFDNREFEENPESGSAGPGFGGVAGSRLYPELTDHIRESHGAGWRVTMDEMESAGDVLSNAGIRTSPEGWCSLAAVYRWRRAGGEGIPMVVLTGSIRPEPGPANDLQQCEICRAETYREIEHFIRRWHPVLP